MFKLDWRTALVFVLVSFLAGVLYAAGGDAWEIVKTIRITFGRQ